MRIELNETVDQAFPKRLAALADRKRLYVAFSGGKDSLTLLHGVMTAIENKTLDPKRVVVFFVDEEAIFPCIESVVREWRDKVLAAGAKFFWLCLEWRHFNCFDSLAEEDSWICWDRRCRGEWVRDMPDFAIKSHPDFKLGMSYQDFCNKCLNDGTRVLGVRISESIQRAQYLLRSGVCPANAAYPIYDFRDSDIWAYLQKYKIRIPDCYQYMWQTGVAKNRLRVSQFFSIDTAHHLVNMVQFYPDLYARILKRVPNAYLAMHYFDSEMFRRRTAKRRKLEAGSVAVNWRDKYYEAIKRDDCPLDKEAIRAIQGIILKHSASMTQKLYKELYGAAVSGDPKKRTIRAVSSKCGITSKKITK